MVSKRKVRLMTQLAIYETRTGKEDIRLSKYYKSDYARLNVLKTAIMTTIGFIGILGFVGLYKLEFLLDNALTMDWMALGWNILGIYIAVMAVYLIFTLLAYSLRYTFSRKKLNRYYRMLGKLRSMIDSEEEGTVLDEENGGNE